VALEFARARLGPGFPWLLTGYTQHGNLALVQLSSVTGVYGLSFLVVFFNAGLARLLHGGRSTAQGRWELQLRVLVHLAPAVLMLLACFLWGRATMKTLGLKKGPVVGLVQQNVPRLVRDITSQTAEEFYRAQRRELQTALELSRGLKDKHIRLLVWPETTVQLPLNVAPGLFVEPRMAEILRWLMRELSALGEEMDCYFLIGAQGQFSPEYGYVEQVPDQIPDERTANSAMMFSPGGQYMGRYDKMHLVPFGEYIPLEDWFPVLAWLTPIRRSIRAGESPVIFELPARGSSDAAARFGAVICYEDVVPSLVRRFRLRGADFLINLTDEGWYHIPGELS